MARLFPFRSETNAEEGAPRVVDLEGEDADAVFAALSSTTARRIYAHLDGEPATPSDIAEAVDSSIQNVRYHLEKLEDAGLVEVVDTWYSSRGNEMSVYATTDGPLIVTSDESRAARLKEALSRLLGGVGVLAGGSLLVQYAATRWLGATDGESTGDSGAQPVGTDDGADDGSSPESTGDGNDMGTADVDENGTESGGDGSADGADGGAGADGDAGADGADGELLENATDNETVDTAADGGAEVAEAVFETLPPGLLFFLGGLTVLLAVAAYWYWYRPAY
ncbi:ArsR family transcriptional regulator [Natrinema saccharevitans]|uniref:ArsR family transcriptional regulator n=1 Tax=Natrinema saccharevitans TaxID=301967 RepID=A0A1S8ASC5_9EURY|nr:helix-turn-helix domain-containing protein [Natrinema saccharevitans]OLZ39778.1 ArsR family transcriptional regulator [Natrinema saccharevitans]